jgi:hypothetical protein
LAGSTAEPRIRLKWRQKRKRGYPDPDEEDGFPPSKLKKRKVDNMEEEEDIRFPPPWRLPKNIKREKDAEDGHVAIKAEGRKIKRGYPGSDEEDGFHPSRLNKIKVENMEEEDGIRSPPPLETSKEAKRGEGRGG